MKINLLVISLFTSLFLNAQIKKGSLFIGGDAAVNGSRYKSTEANQTTSQSNYYSFSPSLGWAVKDNIVIGGRLLASFYDYNQFSSSNPDNKGNNIGAGIWMRKYQPLGKSFYLFADAGINGYSVYRKQTELLQPDYYYKEKGFGVNASIYPGVSYHIKKCLFLEAALNNLISLGYENRNTEQRNPNGTYNKGANNSYNLSSSLSNGVPLQIGIRWIIAKK
jgi:hypothetical protein